MRQSSPRDVAKTASRCNNIFVATALSGICFLEVALKKCFMSQRSFTVLFGKLIMCIFRVWPEGYNFFVFWFLTVCF